MPLRHLLVNFFLLIAVIILETPARAGVQFQPVSPEELKMTSEPLAPGAPAIILYREVNHNDLGRSGHGGIALVGGAADRYEENYFRIKILTEEGRRFANVEIPLTSEVGSVISINARTIHPDGSVVNFDGKVFDQTIVKAKGYQYRARTFVLPDVQVGSVVEYFYTITFNEGRLWFSRWIISNELFTKRAKFTLKPYHSDVPPINFRWSEHVPTGSPSPKEIADGTIQLDITDIAAFHAEDFMPPENELKARVDFIYSIDPFESDATKFWKRVGKKRNDQLESFIGKRSAMEQAVSQIVTGADTPEVKLRKIYARVQQLHNTTYEVRKTEQELKHENIRPAENVEDVWKQGSGNGQQLTWLFLALARAAGFEASGVWVSGRDNYFFSPQGLQSGELDSNVVLVKSNGKDLFLDPGAAYTPFGLLRWEETGVQGLRLDKDGGSWVQTSLPESSASRIERKADLKLSNDGSLGGKLELTFTGLEALRRRLDQRNEDDTARKKSLEEEVKQYVPVASEVELTKQPEWSNSESPLVAEFTVRIPGWASIAGRRALFPVGIFGAPEKHVFEYSNRVHPIYFEFLSQKADDITVEIPSGWQISGVPQPQNHDLRVVGYAVAAENAKGALHLTRKLEINTISIDQKYYSPLRSFYQIVKAGDDQQVILLPGTATSAN